MTTQSPCTGLHRGVLSFDHNPSFDTISSRRQETELHACPQEVYMSGTLSALFLTSASTLTLSVHRNLFYYFNTIPGFDAYPAMTAAYVVGYMIGIVYAFDCAASLRSWRRERAQGF